MPESRPDVHVEFARELMREPSESLAFLALERGLVQPAHVEECLHLLEREGFGRPLHEILVERGYLDRGVVARLLDPGASQPVPPEAAAHLDDPARRLGKFVLLNELGTGAAARVARAWDTDLHRWVAIKLLIRPGQFQQARFLKEAQVAARLAHPGIVAVHEIGEHEGCPYIVMQFVDGNSLSGMRLPTREMAETMLRAAEAVAYAHGQGVIHRDLKPSNILRDRQGRIYVADFGLAREIEAGASLTAADVPVGTPSYMAPEQVTGRRREIDARSDVYGLGATLYALLTGRPPFSGGSVAEILQRVLNSEPVRPRALRPEIAPGIEAICLKAMAKERGRRYAGAGALADDLARFLRGEPIVARPPSVMETLRRHVRHRSKALVLGVLMVILAAAILVQVPPAPKRGDTPQADADGYCRRAWLKKEKGDLRGALEDYTFALRMRLDFGPAYFYRAVVYRDLGDAKAMMADLDQAIARMEPDPQWDRAFVDASVMRGEHRVRAGALELAVEDFTRALERKPDHAEALSARGRCNFELGRFHACVRDLSRLNPAALARVQDVLAKAKQSEPVEATYFLDYSPGKLNTNMEDVQRTDVKDDDLKNDPDNPHVVLWRVGGSSVAARFQAPVAPHDAILELDHLSALSEGLKYRGAVSISIIVNDQVVVGEWRVGTHDFFKADRFYISNFMQEGANKIEIRLVGSIGYPGPHACYWLKRLKIHCTYPPGTKIEQDGK